MKQWVKEVYIYICKCGFNVNDLQVSEELNAEDRYRYRVFPGVKVPPTPTLKEFIKALNNETMDERCVLSHVQAKG